MIPPPPWADASPPLLARAPDLSADEILCRVEAEAVRLGEDPRAILREVQAGTPTGRFVLKLMGLRVPSVRRGRPRDLARLRQIVAVVDALLWDDRTRAKAFAEAPDILARDFGIYGTTRPPRALTVKRVREAYENRVALWFEPISSVD